MRKNHKHTVHRKALYSILVIVLFLFLVATISPKNAVRTTMLIHGASPVATFQCDPEYAPKTSKSLQIPVYDVPNKFAYKDGSTGVRTSTFAIRTYLGIFHVAVTADQYFG